MPVLNRTTSRGVGLPIRISDYAVARWAKEATDFAGSAARTSACLPAIIARLLATEQSEVPVVDDLRPTATASCKRCEG